MPRVNVQHQQAAPLTRGDAHAGSWPAVPLGLYAAYIGGGVPEAVVGEWPLAASSQGKMGIPGFAYDSAALKSMGFDPRLSSSNPRRFYTPAITPVARRGRTPALEG